MADYDVWNDPSSYYTYTIATPTLTGSLTSSLSAGTSGPWPTPANTNNYFTTDTTPTFQFALAPLLQTDPGRAFNDLSTPLTIRIQCTATSPLSSYGTSTIFSIIVKSDSYYQKGGYDTPNPTAVALPPR